ncbi:MAG: hypothetical protein DI598_07550 [Pseudopedobacter saltans]|uniref:Uncharacterized protein n=1 Tax=Pseudopedobacter saltans TaxID=151895 RepID=A0A2W5F004_9SPHI|nr:MAG: hypothetical protein DI598_07550 [Pseudopedobacter saltans]
MVPLLADLSIRLIDSGHIKMEDIIPFKTNFEEVASRFGRNIQHLENDQTPYGWYQMIDLLGRWKDLRDIEILKSYLSSSDIYLQNYIVRKLLEIKYPVPSSTIRALAQNMVSRNGLYDNLSELKRMDLFPKQYLSQHSLAQATIYGVGYEDGPSTPKVTFLKKRVAIYDGKKYNFYLFKVSFKDNNEITNYLGVAGGYKLDITKMYPAAFLSDIYWEEQLDNSNTDELFKTFIREKTESNMEE